MWVFLFMRNLLYSALVVGALALATCDDSQPFHPEPDAATSEYIACPEDVYVDCLSEEEIEVLRNLAVPPAVANTVVHHSWIVEMAKQDGGLERLAEIVHFMRLSFLRNFMRIEKKVIFSIIVRNRLP